MAARLCACAAQETVRKRALGWAFRPIGERDLGVVSEKRHPRRGSCRLPLGARTGPHLGDAEHRSGRHRFDSPGDGSAVHRRRIGWFQPVPVAVLRLLVGPGGHHADLREALRHLRPQAHPAAGDRVVPRRLDSVCPGVEHARADRLSGRSGPRRRRCPAHRDDHRRRHLHIGRAARVQGYLASVWAISSVIGPLLGGVFSQLGIWRGVFLINIPLCLLAAWMFSRHFHEKVTHRHRTVDVLGAALLACAMTVLILAILGGGQTWAWSSAPSISAFAAGAALLVAFVFVERRAAEPVLPLWVFSRRLLCATTIVAFGVGAILMGLTSYVPTFLEGSLRIQPVIAGLALAALTLGWPATASVAGRFYLRWGFKNTAILGATLVIAGSAVLAAAAHRPNVAVVAAVCLVIGGGMGLLAVPTLIAAQSSVGWNERGVVTGNNMFARSLGSAVGVAVFGAIANSIFGPGDVHSVGPAAIKLGSAAVFTGVLVVAVATAVAVLAMPHTPSHSGES